MQRKTFCAIFGAASMKALPKRKGNSSTVRVFSLHIIASMKALPKRKGNWGEARLPHVLLVSLNESPSEKEGKFCRGMRWFFR